MGQITLEKGRFGLIRPQVFLYLAGHDSDNYELNQNTGYHTLVYHNIENYITFKVNKHFYCRWNGPVGIN